MKKRINKIEINKREMDLFNKYYEVDNENRIATIPLHYEKASDLINNKIVSKDNYLFDYEELTSINDMISRIPIMYKVNINIEIDDYEDYDPVKLIDGFNDAMELNQYNYQRENRTKFLKAGLLLFVGISILFFMGYAKLNGLFGSDERADIYSEICDIMGWVFIWEMVTIAFLTPSELGVNSNMFKLRVINVSFLDINNKILISEDLSEKSSEWESERRIEKASKFSLLISGVALISVASITFINTITSLPSDINLLFTDLEGDVKAIIIFSIIASFAEVALELLGGIAALANYSGRKTLRKFSYVFSFILMIFLVIMLIFSLAYGTSEIGGIIRSSLTMIILFLYIFGLFSGLYISKKKAKTGAFVITKGIEEKDIKNDNIEKNNDDVL